jgi:hypothetical protein
MSLEIPVGFAQVAYRFSLVGDPEVMIATMGAGLEGNPAGWQGILDSRADQFIAGFPAGSMAQGWTFLGCRAAANEGGGGSTIYEAPRSYVGEVVTETVPQNCALLVRKGSASPGRRGRGRMYLPPFGLSENQVSKNGMLDPAFVSSAQAKVIAAFGAFDNFILHATSLNSATPAPSEVTSLVVDTRIATQRRRLR